MTRRTSDVGTALGALFILLPILLTIGWAIASVIVFIGLNLIAGFGLSFAEVVGVAFVLALALSRGSSASS